MGQKKKEKKGKHIKNNNKFRIQNQPEKACVQ